MKPRKKGGAAKKGNSPGRLLPSLFPAREASAVLGIWALVVAAAFAGKGVRPSWTDWAGLLELLAHAPRVLAGGLAADAFRCAAMWFFFWTVGSETLRRIGPVPMTRTESAVFPAALGAGLVSLLLFLFGLARLWRPAVMEAAFYAAVAASAWLAFSRRGAGEGRVFEPPPEPGSALHPASAAAAALIAAVLSMNALATAAPEIFYDSLVYHLSLPKLYLLRGGIVPTPENLFSGFPFGVQMLYALALALSGDGLAALLHWSFGLAAALGVWCWMRRYATRRAGVLAVLLFSVCPIAIYASWHCGIDLGGSLFVMTAFFALSRLCDREAGTPERAWPLAAGLAIGFAASTKYNVLPLAAVFWLVFLRAERSAGRPARGSVLMTAAAAAVFLPWLIKNAVFYGNPLYPFLHRVVGWTAPADWDSVIKAGGARDLAGIGGSPRAFLDFLRHPWTNTVGSWPLGDWPGMAYLILLPWAFALRWKDASVPPQWKAAGLLAAGGYLVWCLASHLVRFLLPVLPVLAIVTALAVERSALHARLRAAGWGLALVACMFNLQASFRQGLGIKQWEQLKGEISREEYLSVQRVTYGLPYYRAVEFMNRELPAGSKVLFLGESRAYYMERDFVAATIYDHNPFWTAVGTSTSAAQLRGKIAAMGVSHVFLSARQLHYRFDAPPVMPRPLVRSAAFGEFWGTWLERLFEEREDAGSNPRWMSVYRVLDEPKTDPASFTDNPVRAVYRILEMQGRL